MGFEILSSPYLSVEEQQTFFLSQNGWIYACVPTANGLIITRLPPRFVVVLCAKCVGQTPPFIEVSTLTAQRSRLLLLYLPCVGFAGGVQWHTFLQCAHDAILLCRSTAAADASTKYCCGVLHCVVVYL